MSLSERAGTSANNAELSSTTRSLIALALAEDLGPGDITAALVPSDLRATGQLLAKSALVLAGASAFAEVFHQLDPEVQVEMTRSPGSLVPAGSVFGEVRGRARSLLSGERTALNLLQRASGIATFTKRACERVQGSKVIILDTRKTTPGLRGLEKEAVRLGGGQNHRFGLFDGVLIKDNHLAAMGGPRAAIVAARRAAHHLLKIECEVKTLAELEEALAAGADVILLDNMSNEDLRRAVTITAQRAKLEASGNMTLDRLAEVAATGVDFISMGALTHSAPAADISLELSIL